MKQATKILVLAFLLSMSSGWALASEPESPFPYVEEQGKEQGQGQGLEAGQKQEQGQGAGLENDVRLVPVESAATRNVVNAPKPSSFKTGFSFGTYGRVGFSTDFKGAGGKSTNMVSHAPRLLEGSYAELDFGYGLALQDGFAVRVLATTAFFDEFFHFTGDAVQAIALRNLYAEAEGFTKINLKLWVGSRMYRGDDIYLLDWWPMDSLNTLGGGLSWENNMFKAQIHAGVNRLKDGNSFRRISVPATFGADTITIMERQRMIASGKFTWFGHNLTENLSMKVSVYGEFHRLPDGKLRYSDDLDGYFQEFALKQDPTLAAHLPADLGGVVGTQVGFWGFGPYSHVNIFARFAWGLAAYGEWGVPWGISLERTSAGAKDFVLAASANWENRHFGIMAATFGRLFIDADENRYDLDDYWEGATVVRPAWFITDHFHLGAELSHQWKKPSGLGQDDTLLNPHIVQMSLLPSLSLNRGMYQRPQFRFVYTASWLNGDARAMFPRFDHRRDQKWQHYLGLQVEWWLNSASYP
ncbi:carbohydrate porin [Myxococcota bacterium]|nr:carbohydrate porin [Myxococcota bacterium]